MLVLKRKEGQSLIIGGKIIVKVVEVEGKSVKIGIEAPKDINIVREELIEKAKEKMISSKIEPGKMDIIVGNKERKSQK